MVFANIAATALGVASLILKALTLVVTITDLTATLHKTAKANLLGT